ncbi:MAG TPA: hypothetical protein VGG06_16070 [Thermoanaerobaculia bacterium]
MRGAHDHIVKELGIAFPADLLTLTLPHLAAAADPSKLELVPGRERFHDLLRGRHWYPDLVAEIRVPADPEPRALAHLEIEYEYRKRKLVRLRDYNHVLTLGTGLPVHTAVVYLHGGQAGLTRWSFEEVSFGFVPVTFAYNSLGLSLASARDYLARPEPLAWAFAVLMSPRGFASRAELAIACLRRILETPGLDEDRRFRLLNFVRTYVKMDPQTAPEYEALLREAGYREVEEMITTWADDIRAEGRQEGLEKGIEKGLEEGLEKGIEKGTEKLRCVVLDLLSQRFGRLSAQTRRRIAEITSLDDLADLARKGIRVDSLEELRLGGRP